MRLNEIGQQLRAFRLESGLRAEEIAARLGVSRAALYRYEKGEVIKLDTVQRLAEMLKISPLSLLGIGVEYYNRTIGFFERLRQLEESADQILQISDPFCYLVTSDAYDELVARAYAELAELAGPERATQRALGEQVLEIMMSRKRTYQHRRPGIIAMVSEAQIERVLKVGVGEGMPLSDELRRSARRVAAEEMTRIAELLDSEPMGLQFSVLGAIEPSSHCAIMRDRDRATLAINPFRADSSYASATGVAMVTSAPEAVSSHQRVAEQMWRASAKGPNAASRVREIIAQQGLAMN